MSSRSGRSGLDSKAKADRRVALGVCRNAEAMRMPAVMANPAFAKNPFATIRLHTQVSCSLAT